MDVGYCLAVMPCSALVLKVTIKSELTCYHVSMYIIVYTGIYDLYY